MNPRVKLPNALTQFESKLRGHGETKPGALDWVKGSASLAAQRIDSV